MVSKPFWVTLKTFLWLLSLIYFENRYPFWDPQSASDFNSIISPNQSCEFIFFPRNGSCFGALLSLIFNDESQLSLFLVIWEVSYLIVSTKSYEIENTIFSFITAMYFSMMEMIIFFVNSYASRNIFKSKKDQRNCWSQNFRICPVSILPLPVRFFHFVLDD